MTIEKIFEHTDCFFEEVLSRLRENHTGCINQVLETDIKKSIGEAFALLGAEGRLHSLLEDIRSEASRYASQLVCDSLLSRSDKQ